MGKEKEHTSEALRFAMLFLKKEYPHDLFKEAYKKVKKYDAEFPLNHADQKRSKERETLWNEINLHIPKKIKNTILQDCRVALIAFSKLSIPFDLLIRKSSFEYKPSIQYLKRKESSYESREGNEKAMSGDKRNINEEIRILRNTLKFAYFPKTLYWINREISWREMEQREEKIKKHFQVNITHNIDGIIRLYDLFTKSISFDLNSVNPITVEQLLSCIPEKINLKVKLDGNPSELPSRAMILSIFMRLWDANKQKNKSARLTADIVNEYCFHNSFRHSASKELTPKNILNLWDNSKYKSQYLRGKTPSEIIADFRL